MTRKTTLAHLDRATEPLLQPEETFLTGCSAWMADQRPRVPLFFTGRAIYLLAITTDRLLVFDTPRRGRPLLEADLLLQRRHDALELVRLRARRPMLQLQIAPAPGRVVILEFRPRDRAVGRQLVEVLRNGPGGQFTHHALAVGNRGSEHSGAAGRATAARDPVSDRGGVAE